MMNCHQNHLLQSKFQGDLNEASEAMKNTGFLMPESFFTSLEKIDKPRSLLELIGKGKSCFKDAAEIDDFIRAERDAWED
jgi:hypothetical protein